MVSIGLSYFICVFLMARPFYWYNLFDLVALTLKFYPLFKNFNIGHIFWMASDRAFIFHVCVLYDKTFLLVPNFLTLWPWSLTLFKKFNIGHTFWVASDRAFIFHMCVPYDKNFLWVPKFLTLWPWPWSFTHFSKPLSLPISLEWPVIGISYVCSLWQELSNGTKMFDLVTLTSKFDPHFKNFNFGHIFWMISDWAFLFHMHVPYDKTFILEP
jgi:hypothetical protein